jgi:carbon monoxide dehydrogenase subunit G
MNRTLHADAHIDNSPEAVIEYIADVRNRPLFLPMLKSVSDIQGDPAAAGTTWKWTWAVLGMEFEGRARCLEHEPGHRYSFQSEGGIESRWTYQAEAEGSGAKLTVDLEYTVPERAIPLLPIDSAAEAMRKAEIDRAVQNLKTILDR